MGRFLIPSFEVLRTCECFLLVLSWLNIQAYFIHYHSRHCRWLLGFLSFDWYIFVFEASRRRNQGNMSSMNKWSQIHCESVAGWQVCNTYRTARVHRKFGFNCQIKIKSNNIYCLSQTVTINNSPLLHHKLYIPIIKLGFTIFKDSKQLNIPSGM
jgi:hypothetical protein